MIRVAINGYGRIGRLAHRVILEKHAQEIEVAAINAGSSTDITGWMYLLKYDTVYGPLKNHELTVRPAPSDAQAGVIGTLLVDNKEIPVFSQKDPALLPWGSLGVDVVIESTGAFTTAEALKPHLAAGAKAVLLSAPSKGDDIPAGEAGIPTYVTSVNTQTYQGEPIVSNASCTTNCITPVAKVIQEFFGIEKAMMTTIHGYTSDQRLHDGGHKDYRRARAAGENIIPTSTGATHAAAKALPALADKFTGISFRVPVPVGSLSDFTFLLSRATTKEEVNQVLTDAASHEQYRGVLTVTSDPLVSSDIIGNSHSAIVDLSLTQVVGGDMVKVIAWYDNEYGYTNRLVEEVLVIAKRS